MSKGANKRIRILLVEGDWLLRRTIRVLLNHEPDMEVAGTAKDGAVALEKISTVHPDLVLTDMAMPHMGGLELTYLLRRRFPNIGIVVLGIYNEPEITELCGLCGADVMMYKALLTTELPTVIRMVFAARRQTEEGEGRAVPSPESEELREEITYSSSQ